MALLTFILTIVGISLSGVMVPGPITAATLAAGTRNRHAGAWICAGHMLVELPLFLLVAAGLGTLLQASYIRTPVGLAGGGLLVLMGVQLLASLDRLEIDTKDSVERHPFWIGVVLSGGSPTFILWWATVGLTLTGRAMEFGVFALLLFALLHWLCDVGWLEVLSLAGFQGSRAFGPRSQKAIALVCGVALIGFGLNFLYEAGKTLL